MQETVVNLKTQQRWWASTQQEHVSMSAFLHVPCIGRMHSLLIEDKQILIKKKKEK